MKDIIRSMSCSFQASAYSCSFLLFIRCMKALLVPNTASERALGLVELCPLQLAAKISVIYFGFDRQGFDQADTFLVEVSTQVVGFGLYDLAREQIYTQCR